MPKFQHYHLKDGTKTARGAVNIDAVIDFF